MANNIYVIETLAPPGGPTVTISDDGTGIDWLVFSSSHVDPTSISLQWSFSSGQVLAASGAYSDGLGVPGNRLVVQGIIENARGGAGDDWIAGNILANVLHGDASAAAPGGNDSLYGDEGNDVLFGHAGGDLLEGAEDDDVLYGGVGRDTLIGGSERDLLDGGAGADLLYGGADGHDRVTYAASSAAVTVSLVFGTTTAGHGGDAEGDRLNGINDLVGSAFGDRLTDGVAGTVGGGGNANVFEGGDGYDFLTLGGGDDVGRGDAGRDTLYGGEGSDDLYGGDGDDWVEGGDDGDRVWGGLGFDRVIGRTGNDTLSGGADFDRVYGDEGDDLLDGNADNDLLFGGDGTDQLRGGSGDDTVIGGDGADRLFGGGGADDFRYLRSTEGGDRILDFAGADIVTLQFVTTPTLHWDNVGALDAGGVRLVDKGADVEIRVNADADATIEFIVTVVGVGSLAQSQVDL